MISMGSLNASRTFLAMMMKLQMEWDTQAKEYCLKNVSSNFIVDDVLLYGCTSRKLIDYFRTVLDVLKHHRATLNLKSSNGFRIGASL